MNCVKCKINLDNRKSFDVVTAEHGRVLKLCGPCLTSLRPDLKSCAGCRCPAKYKIEFDDKTCNWYCEDCILTEEEHKRLEKFIIISSNKILHLRASHLLNL